MTRMTAIVLAALSVSTVAYAQAPATDDPIQKPLLAAPPSLRENATVIAWKADFTYDVLKKGTNSLVCYDRSGKPFRDTDRLQASIRRLMRKLGHVDDDGQALYTFHGLSKNAICYLTELGLDEKTIEAIVGKTPETIRHYAKETRRWMLAKAAAKTVIAGRFEGLVGKSRENVGKRSKAKAP